MRRIIDRIREKVRNGQYGLTFHAIEEMAEEEFEELKSKGRSYLLWREIVVIFA